MRNQSRNRSASQRRVAPRFEVERSVAVLVDNGAVAPALTSASAIAADPPGA
jgi:hypothetical protein